MVLGTGMLLVGLMLLGLISSIVALLGIRRYGTRKLMAYGMCGIGVNGLLLLIFTTNFVSSYNRARANRQGIESLSDTIHSQIASNYNPTSGIDGDKQLKIMADYQTKLGGMSQQLSGDDAVMIQAAQAIAKKAQAAAEKMMAANKAFEKADVYNFETLTNQSGLEPRRQAIRDVMVANGNLRDIIANRAELAAAELRSRGISEENIKEFVASVGKPNGDDPALKLRDCATRHSEISLNLLDFMGKQWGNWRYDTSQGVVVIGDDILRENFTAMVTQLSDLENQETTLQGEIVASQNRRLNKK